METKEELINHIKEWIDIEQEVKQTSKQLKELRERKKKLSQELMNVMKENEIECFDINNGKLQHKVNKVKETITKKMLIRVLGEYFKEDNNTKDDIINYILDSRCVKSYEYIHQKFNKT